MARIKHSKALEANPRAAQKQLILLSKLKNRIKQKANIIPGKTTTKQKEAVITQNNNNDDDESTKKKRRWKPGTVVKREIRRLTRSTELLFPKSSFSRVVREICQNKIHNGHEMRFTKNSMKAIQEAAEMFVTETFHKADLARRHAGRETVNIKDMRFSR
jgi:histone H3/H4